MTFYEEKALLLELQLLVDERVHLERVLRPLQMRAISTGEGVEECNAQTDVLLELESKIRNLRDKIREANLSTKRRHSDNTALYLALPVVLGVFGLMLLV